MSTAMWHPSNNLDYLKKTVQNVKKSNNNFSYQRFLKMQYLINTFLKYISREISTTQIFPN